MFDITTQADYREYEQAVKRSLDDLTHIWSGACAGCSDCLECDDQNEPSENWHDLANEPHFSWSACDICNRALGGDRYPVHGIAHDNDIIHFDACSDCMYYVEYGRLDDTTMDQII